MGNLFSDQKLLAIQKEQFTDIFDTVQKCQMDKFTDCLSKASKLDFKYQGLTFYHLFIVNVINYKKKKLQALCDQVYEHCSKLGPIDVSSDYKYLQINYDMNIPLYQIQWLDNDYKEVPQLIQINDSRGHLGYHKVVHKIYHRNIYHEGSITPTQLCLVIKKFLNANQLPDHLDLVIDLLNRIKCQQELDKCAVCRKSGLNITIKPCNHKSICDKCVKRKTNCPICQGSIIETKIEN